MIMVMAADHGGYELKNAIKKHLQERGGFQILDLGTNDGEAVDYPEYGKACGDDGRRWANGRQPMTRGGGQGGGSR